jgi:hypothetical protein
MAVTTTAFNNLLSQLKTDFPDISFSPGDEFRWSPSAATVWYTSKDHDAVTLLHETAHALLGHEGYKRDIELIRLERDAWKEATRLGEKYAIPISEAHVEDALDTYRDWLHARSLCPTCRQNGVQEDENHYACVICGQKWSVNDARHCGLKRQKVN